MPAADAYIEVFRRRMRLHAYRTRGANGAPAGWEAWFDPSDAPVEMSRERAEAVIAELASRPPRPPTPVPPDPGPWRSFLATWRQGWDPLEPEERPLHLFAGGLSVFWHIALFFAMLWILLTGFDPSSAMRQGEQDVVQVEFIGEGVPAEAGGGPGEPSESSQPGQASPVAEAVPVPEPRAIPEPPAASEPASPEPAPVLPAPAFEVQRPMPPTELASATPSAPQEREIPMPAPQEQPLQVSEPVEDTSADFLLPPPNLEIERSVAMPELQAAESQAIERDIPAPPRRLTPAVVAAPAIAGAKLELPTGAAAQREIPMPERATARADTTEEVPPGAGAADVPVDEVMPADSGVTAAVTDVEGDPGRQDEGDVSAVTAGPRPTPAPGAWPDPARADDWGAADRQVDGSQAGDLSGLYDSAGRVRLAETPGSNSSGNPPGTITEEIANLDRAGTWLRRAPTDYEPTSLDRFWRPNETLLEEWVRRSVTTVRIPIPGTSKTLVCQTVLLALGGGCGIEDPNMVDQPASARPPPDVPYKPELQEGGGVGPAG